MKNLIISAVVVAAVSTSVFAEPAVKRTITPEERAKNLQKMYQRTGGFIRRADALSGELVFFNAQKTVAAEGLKETAERLGKTMRITAKMKDCVEAMKVADAVKGVKMDGAAVAVFVVDDAEAALPMFVAPEGGWAIVNVAALKKDAKSEAFVASRTAKEMVRAALYVCGGANSQYENSLMKPVKEPKTLDDLMNSNPPMDVVGRTVGYLPAFGISPNPYTTYLAACKQGWAPAPTNDVQKAIWEKIHNEKERGPVNALKIVPPKK